MNNKIEKAFFFYFIIAAVSYQTSASISILNLYKRWDHSYSPGSLCSFCYLQFIANASGHHQMYGLHHSCPKLTELLINVSVS